MGFALRNCKNIIWEYVESIHLSCTLHARRLELCEFQGGSFLYHWLHYFDDGSVGGASRLEQAHVATSLDISLLL